VPDTFEPPLVVTLTRPAMHPADGVTGITGALAALSEYFTTMQTKQDDCGLDLGWSHPNATVTAKSIDNTAECSGALSLSRCRSELTGGGAVCCVQVPTSVWIEPLPETLQSKL
jgi:hypothetical protein